LFQLYELQHNDTIATIAAKHHIKPEKLVTINSGHHKVHSDLLSGVGSRGKAASKDDGLQMPGTGCKDVEEVYASYTIGMAAEVLSSAQGTQVGPCMQLAASLKGWPP
jgi:hypothetical protein